MDREAQFKRNLKLLQGILPQVAAQLAATDPSSMVWCETRKGEPNLATTLDGRKESIHSNYSAAKEAERWFESLDLSTTKVLYVYGVGLGYAYDVVKEWLQKDPSHYLVFLEDSLPVLRRFLETERATTLLDDKQVQLHYFADFEESEAMFQWITWYFIRLQPDLSALDFYRKHKSARFDELQRKVLHDAVNKEALASEYQRYGASFFRNFYANLLELPRSYHGTALFGAFKGVPAIICGAGPSLNKNAHLLQGLRNRALLFTGGSALNALSSRGILPHFGGGIDPNPPQYERLMTNFAYEVPFFYRSRMYHKAFRAIHGPRLYLNGTGGYPVADWTEEQLGIQGPSIDEGMNVINMLLEVAAHLGCNPIITVGLDLAFTGMKSYAEGVIQNSEVTEEKILTVADMESGAFPREDVNGRPVYTLWKWVGESQWIGDFAQRYPDRTVINATEGGIGFPGVQNLPLEEVANRYFDKQRDLDGWVHREIQANAMPQVNDEKIEGVVDELAADLDETLALCDEVLQEVEKAQEKLKSGKGIKQAVPKEKIEALDAKITEKIAYTYILGPLAYIRNKELERRKHQIAHDWTLRSDRERLLAQLQVNAERVIFIKNAAETNKVTLEEARKDFAERRGIKREELV